MYQYVAAPPGEDAAPDTLWLEAYPAGETAAIASIPFTARVLAPNELDRIRADFRHGWARATSALTSSARGG